MILVELCHWDGEIPCIHGHIKPSTETQMISIPQFHFKKSHYLYAITAGAVQTFKSRQISFGNRTF